MFEYLQYSLYVTEAIAMVVAFVYFNKWKGTHWKWFAMYLAFIVAGEITGTCFARMKMYNANFYFYSYFVIPVEFLFFFGIFFLAYTRPKRIIPVAGAVVYVLSVAADIIYFAKPAYFYFSLSYTVGNVLLLLLILIYFLQLTNSEEVLNFRENILFWISVGLLIYYLGSCPYYGLRNLLVYRHKTLNTYYAVFVYILDCVMYLTFALGFICGKPNS